MEPLIITGMPRSVDGPLAVAVGASGISLGPPPAGGAARPDLKSALLCDFHDEILEELGVDWSSRGLPPSLAVPSRFKSPALRLVGDVARNRAQWGWKDSRATLFLDFWDDLLPEARWLFVYRRPALVVWSLIRDSSFERPLTSPIERARAGFDLWASYGSRMVEFASQNRSRCAVVCAPEDYTRGGATGLDAVLGNWGFRLDPLDLSAGYKPYLYNQRAPKWIVALEVLNANVRRVRRALDALRFGSHSASGSPLSVRSDDREAVGDRKGGRTICVAGWRRSEYSQTFVRAHIERLPARAVVLRKEGNALVTRDGLPVASTFERAAAALLREFRFRPLHVRDRYVARFLRRQKVDAVLAEFGPTGTMVSPACARAAIPLVVHFHGFDAYKLEVLEKYRHEYLEMFRTAAACVVVSRDMKGQLIELGAPPDRVHCNPCGVDVSQLQAADPESAPPTFLAVGRFVDKKGPELTILAFRKLLNDLPESRLIMIGEGPLWDVCKQLSGALGLDDRIEFLGSRPHLEVMRRMSEARAFVQHSLAPEDGDSEGTPVSVLEAGASGLPVVSTRHAGIADAILHSETGFLVEEGDVDGMAQYMAMLSSDRSLAARLGARARSHVAQNHSMEAHIERLWQILEMAIATDGRVAPAR